MFNTSQKRVAAIHDISCFGKCSLTVALPVLSAVGIETAVIPTAILSTHTGGFSGYTFNDLTDDILPVANHWKKEGIDVDAVYTGYLGSKQQIAIVKEAIDIIKREGGLTVVDPVMADHGKLYGGFPDDFPMEMKKLCAIADIITPNITEAVLMLGMEFKRPPHTKEYIEKIIDGLSGITKGKIVLTGVCFDNENIGAATLENGKISYVFNKIVNAAYHGTGDVFASTLLGAILNGKDLGEAAQIACDFTASCIEYTNKKEPQMRYGVNFEANLPKLIKALDLQIK